MRFPLEILFRTALCRSVQSMPELQKAVHTLLVDLLPRGFERLPRDSYLNDLSGSK